MASAILTNGVLFGLVCERHCSENSTKRVRIKDDKDFRFAIKETIEFAFSSPNQPLLLSQKSWTDKRAKYLSTQFFKKWKEVCIIHLDLELKSNLT